MSFLLVTLGLALLTWAIVIVVRGSIFTTIALFFVSTCVFPAEFFAIDAMGLTWTLDRLWMICLAAQVALRGLRGEWYFTRLESTDLAISLFLLWLIARTITQPWGSVLPGQPPTLMHLVNGYLIPFSLYAALRTTKLDPSQLKIPFGVLCVLGFYLGVTAILEAAKLWGVVFPKFITDPQLGIHFGRARGPMLQSVRLGISVIATLVPLLIYTIWLQPHKRLNWLIAASCLPVLGLAIFVTYTRSVWMGLAFVVVSMVWLCLQGLPRRSAIVAILFAGVAVGVVKGPELVAFKREFSAAETRESTFMRAAFAYVSLEMFKDRPVAGFGFNQFQVYNRVYLSDRSTDIRLESIRGYVHHNSFLSLLVDLGIVGFSLYTFVGLAAAIHTILLWRSTQAPRWARGLSLSAISIGGVHMLQMAFHEVSFSAIENSFLFAAIGMVMAARQQFASR